MRKSVLSSQFTVGYFATAYPFFTFNLLMASANVDVESSFADQASAIS